MDGANTEQQIALGVQAQALLNHETFQLAVNTLSGHFVNQWSASAPEDQAKRETLYHQQLALQGIVGILKSWENAGVQAQLALEADEQDAAEAIQAEDK